MKKYLFLIISIIIISCEKDTNDFETQNREAQNLESKNSLCDYILSDYLPNEFPTQINPTDLMAFLDVLDVITADISGFDVNSEEVIHVPIQFHVFNDENNQQTLNTSEIDLIITRINQSYFNTKISFYRCNDPSYIDYSPNYYNMDFSQNEEVENRMIEAYNIDNVINVYVVGSITTSSSLVINGYAEFPKINGNLNYVFIDKDFMIDFKTLEHELGHLFGLLHTHENWGNTELLVESINGSNASCAGDFISDTPASPRLAYFGDDGERIDDYIDDNCEFVEKPNENYTRNDMQIIVSNFMSYTKTKFECRTSFTPEQEHRLAYVARKKRALLINGCTSPAIQSFPVNNAVEVPINGALNFDLGIGTTDNSTFKVYLDQNTIPTTSYTTDIGNTFLNYTDLAYNTTYYWYVETIDSTGNVTATSPIWNFTTVIATEDIILSDFDFLTTRYFTSETLRNYSFSNDGIHLYMVINSAIHHHILPSPYNLSNLGSPNEILILNSSQGGSSIAKDVVVNKNGSVLYVQADAPGGFNPDYFQQYNLSTPYSISSVQYISRKNLNSKNNKMELSLDNSRLYIAYHDFFSTIFRQVTEFEFSTPDDITSISQINTTPLIYSSGQSGGIIYDITDNFQSIYITDDLSTGQLKKFILNTPGDISSFNTSEPQSTIHLAPGERIIKVVDNEERFFTLLNTNEGFVINEYVHH